MNPFARRKGNFHPAWESALIVIGCVIMALSFRLFINANGIVAGGVVGISTILQKSFGWEPALAQWIINLPLLGIAFGMMGRAEGLRSLLGTLALPAAILLTRDLKPLTSEPLLAAIFGGLGYGAGLGLILSARGSVGGFSLVARLTAKRFHAKPAEVIFVLDAITILAGAWIFGAEKAMVGLIAAFLMRRAIERILLGFSRAYVALIVSTHEEKMRRLILEDMDRGLTVLNASGGYTGDPRPVYMVVLGQAEVPRLRALVRQADPSAFMVITTTSEVSGHGFGE
ncbi:YitT family protein [bacterium]|nr:MAG: YitT family protein [bacterium]